MSSSHQVLHNRESRALQYAMRAFGSFGWSQIEIVDDDLDRSAAGGVIRAGFERMVAEVLLSKVGAVAACEVLHFARNSRGWQQLIEMCRVVDTVLIDQEPVYLPRHYSPLGRAGDLLHNPALVRVAERHRASPAAIALSWTIGNGGGSPSRSLARRRMFARMRWPSLALAEGDLAELDHAFPRWLA